MKNFIAALMVLWSATVAAESATVVDNVRANLRSGKGENYRSLRSLPARTEVEVIERDDDYSKVKTADDQTGWVKSSLLVAIEPAPVAEAASQAAAAVDLVAAQKEILAAREQMSRMQGELEKERSRTKGEPLLTTLFQVGLAAFVAGIIAGGLLLRAYYLRRLHGLRI